MENQSLSDQTYKDGKMAKAYVEERFTDQLDHFIEMWYAQHDYAVPAAKNQRRSESNIEIVN